MGCESAVGIQCCESGGGRKGRTGSRLGLRPLDRGRLPQGWNLRLLWKCLALSVLRLIYVPSMTDPQPSTVNSQTINHPRSRSQWSFGPRSRSKVGCWDVGCWDVGCWMLDVES